MNRSDIMTGTATLTAFVLASLAPAAAIEVSVADLAAITERSGFCPGNEDRLSSERFCAIREDVLLSNPALIKLVEEATRPSFSLSSISEQHATVAPIILFNGEGEEMPEVPLPAGIVLFVTGLAALGAIRRRKEPRG